MGAVVYSYSETLNFSLYNRELNFITEEQGIRVTQADSYYSGNTEEPSIPILTHYFEIPEYTKIETINVIPNTLKSIILEKALLKQPQQVIMSKADNIDSEPQVFTGYKFPQTWLYNFGSSMAGSKNIGYVAIYACGYDADSKNLLIPQNFTLDISLISSSQAKKMPDSRITRQVHQELNLDYQVTREFVQETYLLIYPQQLALAYQPLITFREKQGLEVITETTENIYATSMGSDNAQKIRNFIIDKYNNNSVDYVTLGADVEYIPERRLWAFDCNFGIDDENNIPGDIYYANLNGNWNANGNDLYGEDDDDVDHFPEVIIGRLPARTSAEVEAMVTKLIAYEMGYHQDYSQGLGLSQNLWEDSNSVYVQEYIEDMFYPDFINNIILNEEENNTTNALMNFNRNPNIIQHTGHCFWNVIALGNGTINTTFVNNMQNDYAGVMYSIGCWAAAIEFDAIAEKLVRVPEHGITAFVGNSRYGWGAPSADGFGFSEFYQKEFAKLLFQDEITNIAMANQLQKIPFVAYQNGASVYKWCSYQLNTIGDSYYHLFIDEPKVLQVDYYSEGDNYTLFVTDGEEPIEDVVITLEPNFVLSDYNGIASFMAEPSTLVSLYKEGYQIKELLLESANQTCLTDYQIPDHVSPNSDRVINFRLRNSSEDYLDWQLQVLSNNILIGTSQGEVPPNFTMVNDWFQVSFNQPQANILTLDLYDNNSNELLDTKIITVDLAQPEIDLIDFNLQPYPVVVNDYNYFSYKIKNTSAYPLDISNLVYESDDLIIGIVLPMRTSLQPDEEMLLDNDFMLGSDVNLASMDIKVTLLNSFWPEEEKTFTYYFSVGQQSLADNFETEPSWFEESAWQRTTDQAFDGNYSLTCSPTQYGEYDLDLPLLTYSDDITLSFMYKYKMPMYGEDGFSVYVITDDIEERIIFLGSGGALANPSRDVDDFIYSDWAEYSLNLGELLLNKPEIGSQFILRFSFTYIQDENVTNNYADGPDLGIFLDLMQLSHSGHYVHNDEDIEPLSNHISLYPNPIRNSLLSLKHNSKLGDKYEIMIYNLKGQKIASYSGKINSMDRESLQLPIFQNNRERLSSGIYFLKYKTVDTSELKKILFLK